MLNLPQNHTNCFLPRDFSKNVKRLLLIQNVGKSDITGLELFLDKMTIKFNMFHTLMKCRIFGNLKCCLTVTEEMHG